MPHAVAKFLVSDENERWRTYKWVSSNASTLVSSSGQVVGVVTSLHNVDDLVTARAGGRRQRRSVAGVDGIAAGPRCCCLRQCVTTTASSPTSATSVNDGGTEVPLGRLIWADCSGCCPGGPGRGCSNCAYKRT